jgi:Fur family transcriptional regulator, peroxide stress response regulator
MGTVYRNLNILIDQDLVKKIHFGSTFDRFEANTQLHHHFICESCGSIIDLALPVDESLNDRIRKETPFTARYHRIEFFGVCDKCGKSNRE